LILLWLPVAVAGRQSPDAASLIAAARTALGGDAALNAVTSFTVSGTLNQDFGSGHSITSSVAFSSQLPDKFVRIRRQDFSNPAASFTLTEYRGFNGDDGIQETVAPGAPMPVVIPGGRVGPVPTTPEEIAKARQRAIYAAKHPCIEFVLPLFAGFALKDFSLEPSVALSVGNTAEDVVEFKGPDGFVWRLFLSRSSHLPLRITWRAKPLVVASTTSRAVTSQGGQVKSPEQLTREQLASLPTGDPSAGLADVEWQVVLANYKVADGVNWPHRMTTSYGGRKFEDLQLAKFKINPKIDPAVFAPRRQR
jgi:hypothetical protein